MSPIPKPSLHGEVPSEAELRRRLKWCQTHPDWPSIPQLAHYLGVEYRNLQHFVTGSTPLARWHQRNLWEILRKFEAGAWRMQDGYVKQARDPRPLLLLKVDLTGRAPKLRFALPIEVQALPPPKEIALWLQELNGVAKLSRNQTKSLKSTAVSVTAPSNHLLPSALTGVRLSKDNSVPLSQLVNPQKASTRRSKRSPPTTVSAT